MKEYYLTINEYNRRERKVNDGKYIIENYAIYYFKNGLPHRIDGPAQEYNNGIERWYIHGKYFSSQEQMESSVEYYLCINGLENYG